MKKVLILLFVCSVLLSCNQEADEARQYEIVDNNIVSSYYQKDAKKNFQDFIKNPDENIRVLRSARNLDDEQLELSESEMFAEMWTELTEEQKEQLILEIDNAEVSFDSMLAIEKESDSGRSILSGNTEELDFMTLYYGLIAEINDFSENKTIPAYFISGMNDNDIEENCELLAAPIIENYMRLDDWENVDRILEHIDCSDYSNGLREKWEIINNYWNNEQTVSRSSSSTGLGYETALYDNLGEKLKDGDVLLTNGNDKAYFIVGNWSHGGIFSKEIYTRGNSSDKVKCVYTAQPEKSNSSSASSFVQYSDMEPDRYGMACLEPILAYTKMKKFAVLRPRNYSEEKGKKAVFTAKSIYYDKKTEYSLPIYEMFFNKPTVLSWVFTPLYSAASLGMDSSHDLTEKNTYCTKVVYTAWKKNGVDLDSNVFAGNLVSPDDIYGSSINRYKVLKIRVLFWTYTKSWKVYSATTDKIVERRR